MCIAPVVLHDKRTTKIRISCRILLLHGSMRNKLWFPKQVSDIPAVFTISMSFTEKPFWKPVLVPLHVKWQVIWSWKAPVTVRAFEGLCSSMFSVVSCKFIWTSKTPCTALPGTFVRFLSCVGAPVSLEMRAFGVDFGASFIVAFVDSPSFHMIGFTWKEKEENHVNLFLAIYFFSSLQIFFYQ